MIDIPLVYIVKGEVTDPDCHPGSKLGDVEWQFSDGPPGQRGSSWDYLSLTEGVADHVGWRFNTDYADFTEAEHQEFMIALSDHHQVLHP